MLRYLLMTGLSMYVCVCASCCHGNPPVAVATHIAWVLLYWSVGAFRSVEWYTLELVFSRCLCAVANGCIWSCNCFSNVGNVIVCTCGVCALVCIYMCVCVHVCVLLSLLCTLYTSTLRPPHPHAVCVGTYTSCSRCEVTYSLNGFTCQTVRHSWVGQTTNNLVTVIVLSHLTCFGWPQSNVCHLGHDTHKCNLMWM